MLTRRRSRRAVGVHPREPSRSARAVRRLGLFGYGVRCSMTRYSSSMC
jgi:hypothetical protein